MKSTRTLSRLATAGLLLILMTGLVAAQPASPESSQALTAPVGTAFTYQGHLIDGGAPANGPYDLRFRAFNQAVGGTQIGLLDFHDDLAVVDGLFSVAVDLGPGVFNGQARWLEIEVRPGPSTGAFTLLSPRTPLTAVPYAFALPGLWTQPNPTSTNLIGGYWGNIIPGGVVGATISGGGDPVSVNEVLANYSTVGGGFGNIASASEATVAGGAINTASGATAAVGGGGGNVASATAATVAGGAGNTASGVRSTVSGGTGNAAPDPHSTVGGGLDNQAAGEFATVGGGKDNVTGDWWATISGGGENTASGRTSTVGGGWANLSGGYLTTVGGGDSNQATGSWATVSGGYVNIASNDHATVAGGERNTASGEKSTIAGGLGNVAAAPFASIGGGGRTVIADPTTGNLVSDRHGTVAGGGDNQAGNANADLEDARFATVAGGRSNTAGAHDAAVGGGALNQANNVAATVAGGAANEASGVTASVGGGDSNTASGWGATVAGGASNTASSLHATVAGGQGNQAQAALATIAGGGRTDPLDPATGNVVSDRHGFIGGGGQNLAGNADGDPANASFATVSGGRQNQATANFTVVGGGRENSADGQDAVASGGAFNRATGVAASVGGGAANQASGVTSWIGGGDSNTASGWAASVGGGWSNEAGGNHATIPGGFDNSALGTYSFAAGRRAHADAAGCFVWGDSVNADVACSAANQWVARATGGAVFFTNAALTSGVRVPPGGNAWSVVSDQALKDNLSLVDGQQILARLAQVPISTWNYLSQDESIRHMGPMAQDFYAAFGLGEDERAISTVDADGVSLAAIQGLYRIVQEQEAQLAGQQQQIEALEARLERLEQRGAERASSPGLPLGWLLAFGLAGMVLVAGQQQRGRGGAS